jgi:hypothetical protein
MHSALQASENPCSIAKKMKMKKKKMKKMKMKKKWNEKILKKI